MTYSLHASVSVSISSRTEKQTLMKKIWQTNLIWQVEHEEWLVLCCVVVSKLFLLVSLRPLLHLVDLLSMIPITSHNSTLKIWLNSYVTGFDHVHPHFVNSAVIMFPFTINCANVTFNVSNLFSTHSLIIFYRICF